MAECKSKPDPSAWFANTMLSGIQTLYVLRLEGSPSADTLPALADAWISCVWATRTWIEQRDAQRITRAFTSLAASAKRWPAPADLLTLLPRIDVPQQPDRPGKLADKSNEIATMLRYLGGRARIKSNR